MARNGFDVRELEKFRDNLVEFENKLDVFISDCAKELAARLLREVIKRTPLGKKPKINKTISVKGKHGSGSTYEVGGGQIKRRSFKNNRTFLTAQAIYWSGYVGGTLRRGWTSKTESEAESRGSSVDPVTYASTLPIVRSGNLFRIVIVNPVEYASYVEYGHRQTPGRYVPALGKRLKEGWVPGKFMLTISAEEIQRKSSQIIEKFIAQKLGEYLR